MFTGVLQRNEESCSCLLYGKTTPALINTQQSFTIWKGKNVKHDELDLEVPMNDIGACFLEGKDAVNILTADNQLRLYDFRGTKRRPISDVLIKGVAPRSKMTKLSTKRRN